MYKDLSLVYECYSCGLFVKEDEESNLTQRCPRCDSKIKTEKKHSIDSLYYALSAIFLFIILSTYPFITLDLNEQKLQATLIKTVVILFEQDFFFFITSCFIYYCNCSYFKLFSNYFFVYSS